MYRRDPFVFNKLMKIENKRDYNKVHYLKDKIPAKTIDKYFLSLRKPVECK